MAADRTEIFRSYPVPKAIATMAIPTIISQMINLIYNMADTFFIGRTGNSYMVAAASVGLTVFLMTISFANLFGIGGGSLMARLAGSGEGAAETVAVSAMFLGIRCFASPVQFLNFSNSYAMQAVGFGGGTLIHAVVRILGIYIPFMFLLNSLFGMTGLVSAIVAGEAISGIFALLLFRYLLNRNRFQQDQ